MDVEYFLLSSDEHSHDSLALAARMDLRVALQPCLVLCGGGFLVNISMISTMWYFIFFFLFWGELALAIIHQSRRSSALLLLSFLQTTYLTFDSLPKLFSCDFSSQKSDAGVD